ncbi:GTP cyclohydrolase II [Bradyrhizobium sp. SYSU BS000235]|uniref:GTP cyclohydrolase II n=1 Tax=Bradyrhizobium sp. SYSU BS000235 TaxID=3411332 RepID=UPI003C75BD25
MTAQRARAMGIEASTTTALSIPSDIKARDVFALATAPHIQSVAAEPANAAATAAIRLIKLSRGVPAALVAKIADGGGDVLRSIAGVEISEVDWFFAHAANTVTMTSDALIPLSSKTTARFVIFRDVLGLDQVAVIVGQPDFSAPVPVRLHSACLTGDVFGSRRCDCGDQLKLSLKRLEDLGGGVVLYLAQEGRGIGLANKMRAYRLQDDGFDTHDANTMLGFEDDERNYGIAAAMLAALNCTQIVLLTNNPAKMDGLTRAGVEVSSRIPLQAPVHSHNVRYLRTKALRSGHKLNGLTIPDENDA